MGGKLRYWLAAGFVAVFCWIASREPDHQYLAFLETRSWLTGDDTPLGDLVAAGDTMPAFEVDVQPENRLADYLVKAVLLLARYRRGRWMPSRTLCLEVARASREIRATSLKGCVGGRDPIPKP